MGARVAFLGSPDFAVPSLCTLAAAGAVALVITQPDRPAGRGRALHPTAVRRAAQELGLEVAVYERERRGEIETRLAALALDALVVVAFGHILRPSTLATARLGAVNVHASLLPRWRGVAPIERALLAGDAVTGITLMALDAGVDTGPVLQQRIVPITPDDTRATLASRLAERGAELLGDCLQAYLRGELAGVPQDGSAATYAPRLDKESGRIDWRGDPVRIWNQVRALYGWPGAFTELGEVVLKVHAAQPLDLLPRAQPGTIVVADARRGVHVACGGGTLELLELQLPGKPRLPAVELVRGRALGAGVRLGP